jgi:N-methylhydantoinase B
MNAILKEATDVATATADPITLEIVRGALKSAQLEMGSLIERTAMSPVIREKQDYFTGLVDRNCRLLIGTRMPSGGSTVPPVLAQYPASEMREGDIYLYNDCYGTNGAVSHSPDMVFVTPVFVEGELQGFCFAWAHFIDVGGANPGSTTPNATNVFQEGIIMPVVRFARDGVVNDELFRFFVRNSRFPEVVRGDTRSMIAAVRLGEKRLKEIFTRFGPARANAAFSALIDQTARAIRERMFATFPPGRYRFADITDEDGHGSGPIAVRMTLISDGKRLVLDTTESDDQVRGPVNFLMSELIPSMVFGLFMTGDDPTLLPNDGMLHVIDEVRLRPGSILKPKFPAPLGQRATVSRRVHTSCFGLVGIAKPERAHGSSSAYSISTVSGVKDDGKPYLKTMGFGVGQGARPFADGIDAVYYIAQRNYPVEFAEQNYPLRVLRYGIHEDSGGPGKWRGGCGIVREVELLGDVASLNLRLSNCLFPCFGVTGGMCGRPGRFTMNPGTPEEKVLPFLAEGVRMNRGDVLRIETPGGGGFGHPFDRDPALVLRDVLGDFVSPQSAEEDYGVVIDLGSETVDEEATRAVRERRRWPAGPVHRGGYHDEDSWYEASWNHKRSH